MRWLLQRCMATMSQLTKNFGTMSMHSVCHFAVIGNNLGVPSINITTGHFPTGVNGLAFKNDEPHPTPCSFLVIGSMGFRRQAINMTKGRIVRLKYKAIAKHHFPDGERRKQQRKSSSTTAAHNLLIVIKQKRFQWTYSDLVERHLDYLSRFGQNGIGNLESRVKDNNPPVFKFAQYNGHSPLADWIVSFISLIVNAVTNCFSHCFNASTFIFFMYYLIKSPSVVENTALYIRSTFSSVSRSSTMETMPLLYDHNGIGN